jgi:futalosine hydrolase
VRVLYAYAAAAEGEALANWLSEALQTGVGKTASAVAMAERLYKGPRPDLVCLFGVCGAYPEADPPLAVYDLCVVSRDVLADDGLATEDGFSDLTQMDLGMVGPFAMDEQFTAKAAAILGDVPIVHGATVSTCSGTNARSREIQRRTGAHVETMEGAAIAVACRRHSVPLVQLRCVSNRTGDRRLAGTDFVHANARLQEAVLKLAEKGWF